MTMSGPLGIPMSSRTRLMGQEELPDLQYSVLWHTKWGTSEKYETV